LDFDVHLMIENPENYVEAFAQAGADNLTVHIEATRHAHRLVQQIKSLGVGVGVALNPATPLEELTYLLQELDLVLLMTVNPGFGGQKFIPAVLPKIVALSGILKEVNPQCRIEVDGGMNLDTVRLASKAGAEILVAGAAVFTAPDPAKAMVSLLEAALEEQ
jgi:ribulose-phosphate 3-epimerase